MKRNVVAPTTQTAAAENGRPRQKRAEATRQAVLRAVVTCLDELGYAETSFSAIQSASGMSRGSVNYHFPTRHDMIVAAAALMLDNAKTGAGLFFQRMHAIGDSEAYGQVAHLLWSKIVNTAEGRAFVELLVAARTDAALEKALQDKFKTWDVEVDDMLRDTYPADPETMVMVWDLCRTYLRGLLLQAPFAADTKTMQAKVDRFAQVVGQFVQHQSGKT
ncbi:MAG: TetR/AcrR family transcriptional regulator [Shimia sp.]|uniref:TetR/AcrR family transcriptional regulator n=1 Tax=Shimia sp. TaxID=1954381 RepID=UPI004059A328